MAQSQATSTAAPGQGLGIASLVLSILGISPIGLTLGIIGLVLSKKAQRNNIPAIIGIVLGGLGVLVIVPILMFAIPAGIGAANKCDTATNGVYHDGSLTYGCRNGQVTTTELNGVSN